MSDNEDGKDVEMGEVGTVRRRSEYDENPLKWELDGEVGVWDMCIVMGNIEKPDESKEKALAAWDEVRKARGALLLKLQAVGIVTQLKWSADRKSLYCLLSATRARYELQAELMQMEFELQPRYGGGFLPFVRSNKSVFLRAFNDEFFTMTQRQAILKDIINQSHFKGGASVSIKQEIAKGTCSKWFPFHTTSTKAYLQETWATWKVWHWFRPQPLDQMQTYLGEELTLYFAWLGFYNWALIVPAIVGFVVFFVVIGEVISNSASEISQDGERAGNIAGWFSMLYAVAMMAWATLFLEFWKRYNARLAFQWNMLSFEQSERSRPEYRGELELGVHTGGEWVPFEKDDEALANIHVVPTINYPQKLTKWKIAAGFIPLLVILAIVVIAVMSVLALRLALQRSKTIDNPTIGGTIGSIIGAVLIIIFNVLYGKLAIKLNQWENHRTETEFQDALIFKTFLFQFVNTFSSLYYIAFAKRANDFGQLVGTKSLQDKCKTTFMDERGEYVQLINEDFFSTIGWTANYTAGEGGRPGTLVATDDLGNLWEYNRTDDKLAPDVFITSASGAVDHFLTTAWPKWGGETEFAPEHWSDALDSRMLGSGCMSELVLQLGTLMLINIVIGQAKEVFIPLLKVQVGKLLSMLNVRKMEEDVTEDELKRPWEVEAKLVPFAGTFDEYSEMAIQFCLVTAFAAAFPLAPFLALLNNTVEVRTDAIKILMTNNKPYYKGAQDIGGWYGILELIGVIAVVTNSLLIMLGFSVLPVLVHGGIDQATPANAPADTLPLKCFIIAILIEHVVFILKFGLAELVPDMPADVRRQLARREFLKEELTNELEHRPHFRVPDAEMAAAAGDVFSYDTDSSFVDEATGIGSANEAGVVRAMPVEKLVVSAEEAGYDDRLAAEDEAKRAKKARRDEKKRRGSAVVGKVSSSLKYSSLKGASKRERKDSKGAHAHGQGHGHRKGSSSSKRDAADDDDPDKSS